MGTQGKKQANADLRDLNAMLIFVLTSLFFSVYVLYFSLSPVWFIFFIKDGYYMLPELML